MRILKEMPTGNAEIGEVSNFTPLQSPIYVEERKTKHFFSYLNMHSVNVWLIISG